MTDAYVVGLGRQAMILALEICAPVLVFGLVAGLVISIFQAATQIQEMTLSFLPKVLAMALAVVIFGPWMLNRLMEFTTRIFNEIPTLIR